MHDKGEGAQKGSTRREGYKMNKMRTILIGVAIVSLVAVNTVYAWGRDGSKNDGKEDKAGIFKELNLTEEQQKMMKQNRTEQRQETEELFKSIKEERAKLQQALQDPSVTKDKVELIVAKIKSLEGEMVDNRVNGIFKVKEILTPEQYAKFNEMMEKQKSERGRRFRKGGRE